ncbi:uncharacterized protein KD926_004205 [Aspergillus affinis]|uniref:uncharacterized protein n=1 Tax=Aspergillus affinis TaxID=1070780 RepID=UPI0022FF3C85|nr:uncharacterized protein KD926_004205 [Aspergillus affinis]KAI9046365.1 hypothetical protein KD926_004205 [Aspergillus affinis]
MTDIDQLLSKLTLEEKVSLLATVNRWRTPVFQRDGVFVPHIKATDGPNGARGESYVSGIKAACFPCATSLGATFDRPLVYRVGEEVAKEAKKKAANVLLAPTLNVIRSPLGGRNYETYSEDPLVLGELASEFVKDMEHSGYSHLVAHSCSRTSGRLSAEIDEQTLRKIYLLPFQLVVKDSNPLCFMTSYNLVNGTYEAKEVAIENPGRDAFIHDAAAEGMVLLKNSNDILPLPAPSENFKAAMIGQFAGVASLGGGGSARVDSIRAVSPLEGMDTAGYRTQFSPGVPVFKVIPHAPTEMILGAGNPGGNNDNGDDVRVEWYNGNVIGENLAHTEMRATPDGHHHRSIITTGRAKCYIEDQLLYKRKQETDLSLESFYFFKAKLERRFDYPMEAGRRYTVVVESWATEPELCTLSHSMAAVEVERQANVAVVCVGNTNEIESEGFDRDTMDLLGCQNDVIQAVAAQNPRTVVVNFSGAAVSLTPFLESVGGVVQAWFPGQECGHSLARVLTGAINPSGRLPFSWPARIKDNSSYGNFPANSDGVLRYEEGLAVGYRYYDRPTSAPLFPFGFGLSYTSFEVDDAPNLEQVTLQGPNDLVEVFAMVRNLGQREGRVAVQFYVGMSDPSAARGQKRPFKELKGFAKVHIRPNSQELVSVILDKYSVSYYDPEDACWRADGGRYTIYAGLSAMDIKETAILDIPGSSSF